MRQQTTLPITPTINDLVHDHPELIEVFARFGLDTCCGGARTIDDAARAHGLDPLAIHAAVRAALESR